MNSNYWTRTRAANQPSVRKKRDFDEQNAIAATVILESPNQHSAFQVDWAKAFTRRRAAESTPVDTNAPDSAKVDRIAKRQQSSGQICLL